MTFRIIRSPVQHANIEGPKAVAAWGGTPKPPAVAPQTVRRLLDGCYSENAFKPLAIREKDVRVGGRREGEAAKLAEQRVDNNERLIIAMTLREVNPKLIAVALGVTRFTVMFRLRKYRMKATKRGHSGRGWRALRSRRPARSRESIREV